jgi:hypothetical protein
VLKACPRTPTHTSALASARESGQSATVPFISRSSSLTNGDLVPDGNPDRDEILWLPGAAGHPERRT